MTPQSKINKVGIFSVQEELIVDNAGLPQASDESSMASELLSEFSSAPVEDIPEAVREHPQPSSRSWFDQRGWRWGLSGIGILLLLCLPFLLWSRSSPPSRSQPSNAAVPTNTDSNPDEIATVAQPASEPAEENPSTSLLGHFPYEEAPRSELVSITDDGSILLRQAAAEKFLDMMAAAKAEGVEIVPLSGFRSIDEQEGVFFDVKAERGQEATKRAEVSAPPGYSEHHTGYAIDVGDRYYPDADLRESFENTPAFKWLQSNAGYYSFELSFPKGNAQNVSYEPWHWRFVGDRDSLETFYRVRGTRAQPTVRLKSRESADE
ncbi:D-alanyl-D-alanine carboxypeptidase family protein [Thermocoleostomius sinensis A174]|uniref:D-alanyl-D-alanine carboxypeptidase family protein n=1 Tax=Thermocoleostomius sinensis A174 TaxID=2016057 RepID=A0A9E9C6P1_9CYAN|nr:M15 family metallopeptidase [Thermocoleostomius sinensis]WAL59464.1 D-alanyl-D-alanine carboxypeptidase family protein [Thermocoleostomius sinensis A174]